MAAPSALETPSTRFTPVQTHVCFPCRRESGRCPIHCALSLFLEALHSGPYTYFPAPYLDLKPGAEPSRVRGAHPALTGHARAGAGGPGSSSSARPERALLSRAAAAIARAALRGSRRAPGPTGGCPGPGEDARGLGPASRPASPPPAARAPQPGGGGCGPWPRGLL